MEITRSGILREVLEEKNREMHKYSRHEAGLLPLEGYEKHFEDLRQTCELLRGMIRNAEERERETRLAAWQMDVITADAKGDHPDMIWPELKPGEMLTVDGEAWYWDVEGQEWVRSTKRMTPDEAVLRRRYRQAEGFKPEPVVYPGGSDDGTV